MVKIVGEGRKIQRWAQIKTERVERQQMQRLPKKTKSDDTDTRNLIPVLIPEPHSKKSEGNGERTSSLTDWHHVWNFSYRRFVRQGFGVTPKFEYVIHAQFYKATS